MYVSKRRAARRTLYLTGLAEGHLYVGEMDGTDLDIHEVKGKGPHLTRTMIHSCTVREDDRTDPSGENILLRYLPLSHVPPLTAHHDPLVRDAAYARLSGK